MGGCNSWFRLTAALVVVVAMVAIIGQAGNPSSVAARVELCEGGTPVPDAVNNPGLVADCTTLLGLKDTLRGTAMLNWSASAAISDWAPKARGAVLLSRGKATQPTPSR